MKHTTTIKRNDNKFQASCTSCGDVGKPSHYEWHARTLAEQHEETGAALRRH